MFFKNLKTKTYHLPSTPPAGGLQPRNAFTLLEIMIVVVIIGILTTAVMIGTSSARSKARDQKRLSDVKQMQTALENYFNLESAYPTTWLVGTPLIAPTSGKTLMVKMPSNPTPWVDQACTSSANYAYSLVNSVYNIDYCLANTINNVAGGRYAATPYASYASATSLACVPNCSGHTCGSDGCGGICSPGCVIGDCSSDQTTCTADASTVFLAHFNNNIYDSSFSRTKFGMSSGYFSGSASNLAIPSSSDFDFGSNNFTVDFWINFTDVTTAGNVFIRNVDGNNYNNLYWSGSATGYFNYYQIIGGATQVQAYTGNLSLVNNTWYHVAFVRNGNSMLMFLNGVSKALTQSPAPSGALSNLNSSYYIGGSPTLGTFVKAYIDEYRVSKGLARWTSGFTPSTSAYTVDANTQLLLHMDGGNGSTTFTDSETSAKTVTATNVVQYSGSVLTNTNATLSAVQAKFGSYASLFSGTNSYLSVPDSTDFDLSSGNSVVDFWFYPTATTNPHILGRIKQSSPYTGWYLYYDTSKQIQLYSGNNVATLLTGVNTVLLNQWSHVAIVVNGASTTIYINGISKATTASNVLTNYATPFLIGGVLPTAYTIFGYIDEFRISKGTNRGWTTNFTPPTLEY